MLHVRGKVLSWQRVKEVPAMNMVLFLQVFASSCFWTGLGFGTGWLLTIRIDMSRFVLDSISAHDFEGLYLIASIAFLSLALLCWLFLGIRSLLRRPAL